NLILADTLHSARRRSCRLLGGVLQGRPAQQPFWIRILGLGDGTGEAWDTVDAVGHGGGEG
ncbi:MAG: hypothetical protein CRN43_22820, partial [Candidatus Nephrothrix sp. EaCA]